MSLVGVLVGDEVVLQRERETRRTRVEAVGRKWVTVEGRKFDIATGRQAPPIYGHAHVVFTLEQRAHVEAARELAGAIQKVADCESFKHLSTDDMRTITAELNAIVARLSP